MAVLNCRDCGVEWSYWRLGDDETCWLCGVVGKSGALWPIVKEAMNLDARGKQHDVHDSALGPITSIERAAA